MEFILKSFTRTKNEMFFMFHEKGNTEDNYIAVLSLFGISLNNDKKIEAIVNEALGYVTNTYCTIEFDKDIFSVGDKSLTIRVFEKDDGDDVVVLDFRLVGEIHFMQPLKDLKLIYKK